MKAVIKKLSKKEKKKKRIASITLPDHMFDYGEVIRDAIVMEDGSIHIRTLGYGKGYWGSLNIGLKNWAWDSVDQKVVSINITVNHLHSRLRKYIYSNHKGSYKRTK
jgi:hypothetical protein